MSDKKVCAVCGKEIGLYDVVEKDGKPMHSDCAESYDLEEHLKYLQERYPTDEKKLARIVRSGIALEEAAKQLNKSLGTIRSIMLLLAVLVIAGVILQSCSAIGL